MPTSLRHELQGILADELLARLDDGLGWQIEADGQPLGWAEIEPPIRDDDQIRWTVVHESGLRAAITVELQHAHHAASLQVTLHNPADRASIPLSAVKPAFLTWSGLPRGAIRVRALGGGTSENYYPPAAYREHAVLYRPVSSESGAGGDRIRIESGRDGRSSNKDLPFLQMTVGDDVAAGLVVALEWSGMWYQELGLSWSRDPLVWAAGIPIDGLALAPGETLALPAAHLIAFGGDEDAGGNACRRYLYDCVALRRGDEQPLPFAGYNHWFGIENAFDQPLLLRQIDRAAELGLEPCNIDGGWYGGCAPGPDHWAIIQGLGNWEREDPRFTNGLQWFAQYVHDKGMRFGVWFEPERAHRTSDLAREHPEWFVDLGGPFLHLNLAIPQAQDYLIRVFDYWIKRIGLDWVRWDYNTGTKPYWEHLDPTGKIQFAYIAGLYRVMDTVMREHPSFTFEGCASGGRRLDLGLIRRSITYWFSDHTEDPLICRFMQNGANRFMPGHIANSALAVMTGAGDGTIGDVDFVSRMCGTFFLSGDIASWSPAMTARARQLLDIYREFRHLLVADFYPLTPQPARPEEAEVVQFVSRDGDDAVILAFSGPAPLDTVTVRPRALDSSAGFRVWDPLAAGGVDGGREQQATAQALLKDGLTLPLGSGAAIRRLRRVP